jgi:anti-sigma B factor antagonist
MTTVSMLSLDGCAPAGGQTLPRRGGLYLHGSSPELYAVIGNPVVTTERVGNHIVILEPAGRLTAETAHVFKQTVAKWVHTGRHELILDLQHVNYLDSAGLGALAHAYTLSRTRGGRLVLANVVGRNKKLLTITRLLTVFQVYETTSEAERSFARPTATAPS